MMASGSGEGGVVVRNRYGLPKLKISSTQPSGVMSCSVAEGEAPSWIQKHLTVSARIGCGLYSWYFTGAASSTWRSSGFTRLAPGELARAEHTMRGSLAAVAVLGFDAELRSWVRRFFLLFVKHLVDERDGDRSFADGRCHALDIAS